MGEIRFDVARMKEVNSRLEEITEQLTSSAGENSSEIEIITNNITGDEVINALKNYRETSDSIITKTKTQLAELKQYLQEQIVAYTATEEAGSESLSDIQSILGQIES